MVVAILMILILVIYLVSDVSTASVFYPSALLLPLSSSGLASFPLSRSSSLPFTRGAHRWTHGRLSVHCGLNVGPWLPTVELQAPFGPLMWATAYFINS